MLTCHGGREGRQKFLNGWMLTKEDGKGGWWEGCWTSKLMHRNQPAKRWKADAMIHQWHGKWCLYSTQARRWQTSLWLQYRCNKTVITRFDLFDVTGKLLYPISDVREVWRLPHIFITAKHGCSGNYAAMFENFSNAWWANVKFWCVWMWKRDLPIVFYEGFVLNFCFRRSYIMIPDLAENGWYKRKMM